MATPTLTRVLKPGVYGKDVQGVRRACKRFLRQEPPTASLRVQRTFNASMTALVKAAQDEAVIARSGWVGPQLMAALRRDQAFDAYAVQLLEQYAAEQKPAVPPLGPIVYGGKSILLHDLTHATSGVPGFPAFDDGFGDIGRAVLAPEPVEVYQQSGSQGGDAFYMRGVSGIEYWIGHIDRAPATGSAFSKGATLAHIAWIAASDGGPHVHCGINAAPLIGHELLHHTNYTHGAPTVGAQLEAALGGR